MSIDIIFPNGGIQIPEYSEAELEWNLVEQNSQGTELNIWVSHELGGWFIPVAESIDAHVLCLRENGYKVERAWTSWTKYILSFVLGAYVFGVFF